MNWMHGWEDFKEDFLVPADPTNDAHLAIRESVPRHQPVLARGPFHQPEMVQREWPFHIHRNPAGIRFRVQVGCWRASGPNLGPFQVVTMGTGNRPAATGNLTVSVFLTPSSP